MEKVLNDNDKEYDGFQRESVLRHGSYRYLRVS